MVLALLCANLHAYLHLSGADGDHFVATEQSPCLLSTVTATPTADVCLEPPTETLFTLVPSPPEQVRIAQPRTFRTPRAPPTV